MWANVKNSLKKVELFLKFMSLIYRGNFKKPIAKKD